MSKNVIELLGEDYIRENKDMALEILGYSSKFGVGLGWHYLLDLMWIFKNLDEEERVILDAGSGAGGLLQLILSYIGKDVLAVDMVSRENLIKQFGDVFDIRFINKWTKQSTAFGSDRFPINLIHSDLRNLAMIEDNSVDAVVSVSALEHNPPQEVKKVIKELSRVLKKNKKMLVTISAHKNNYYHQPTGSWVLNEEGLIDAYELQDCESNFKQDYDKMVESINDSVYLRNWLGIYYYRNSNAIAPGPGWNPAYYPVGVIKINK